MNPMRIWVGVLADYNAGRLHGAWFDLDDYTDAEDLENAVRKGLLVTSKYPNVLVQCPFCADGTPTSDHDLACTHCKGTGEVPAAEEWGIFDHEGFPEDSVGEYPSFTALFKLKELMEAAEDEFGPDGPEIVEAYVACFDVNLEDLEVSTVREAYRGEYASGAKFSEELARETEQITDDNPYASYINWEQVWNCEDRHAVAEHNDHYFWRD